MITGVLGALAQKEVRRMLSFLIISGIGFAIMGLGLFTAPALSGSVFYIIHSVVVTTGLFLMSGVIRRLSGTEELQKSGGLFAGYLGTSVLFFLLALSIAGIPPMAGFFGKFLLLRASLESGQYVIAAIALVVSLLTLLAMTKIWSEVFWKPVPEGEEGENGGHETRDTKHRTQYGRLEIPGGEAHSSASPSPALPFSPSPISPLLLWPVAALALLTVGIGLAAEPVYSLSTRAAEQLTNPAEYIRVVLGEAP
jgi:multicomponent Na+:H+ antiporter subunit D